MATYRPSSPHFSRDPWMLRETRFDVAQNYLTETLFALGNGTIGLRGTQDEVGTAPADSTHEGNYLNGFYESEPIDYPEVAYGLAQNNQFMLNLPNAKLLDIRIDGEPFNLQHGTILDYERVLDFRRGVLSRAVNWQSPNGHQIRIRTERIVCFERRHVFAVRCELQALNFSGVVQISSSIDTQAKNLASHNDPRAGTKASGSAFSHVNARHAAHFMALEQRTHRSRLGLVTALLHDADGWQATPHATALTQCYERQINSGQTVSFTKFGCYVSSRDVAQDSLQRTAETVLRQARQDGFDQLCREQAQYLNNYWSVAGVDIQGDGDLEQGMHFNQFHLLQSVGRDGKTNIAAKGLSGEGYEGHYFWDTEIYVMPFFLYNRPEIARQLLTFRYSGLDQARQRARQMGHAKGALFPWRTIAGEECSAYFPAGTAQYHINADIAYAVKQYFDATDDIPFLLDCGAEVVLETARIWLDLGHFTATQPERFHINEVTGPDEYSALVNNNYYTNLMAQAHLQFALAIAARMQADHQGDWQRIAGAIGLDSSELDQWQRAAQLMLLPYDERLGIHAQDDSFLNRKQWDFAGTPADKYPLLLHFHPLVIYRHQVCKQADLLLAMLLQSDRFTLDEKRRNFDYYEKITTHDSSLSSCIFSIIASEIGAHDKAYAYFMETARLDLDDTHHNTCHGVHAAAMAGSWMCVTYGFAGLRVVDGNARFNPVLPEKWTAYRFQLRLRGALIEVSVNRDGVQYELLNDQAITLRHAGQSFHLAARQSRRFAMGAVS